MYIHVQWLEEEFLPYLDSWEESVCVRKGFDDKQKENMLLSDITRFGLRVTGNYYIINNDVFNFVQFL